MFHFKAMDFCVVERTIRKKVRCTEEALLYVKDVVPDVKPFIIDSVKASTVYECCTKLSGDSEYYESCDWFISEDRNTAMSASILCVIGKSHRWDLLQDEERFNEWIKVNVR